jgi:hypothetical protein
MAAISKYFQSYSRWPILKNHFGITQKFEKKLLEIEEIRSKLWGSIQKATFSSGKKAQVILINDTNEKILIDTSQAIKILSRDCFGNEKRVDQSFRGHHPVVPLKDVFFKNNLRLVPLDPMMEMAMYDLYQLLFDSLLAPCRFIVAHHVPTLRFDTKAPLSADLLSSILNGTQSDFLKKHPEHQKHVVCCHETAVLQASKAILGPRLKEYLEEGQSSPKALQAIDFPSFSQHFILSILTHAADHKPENFILASNNFKIVGVDNDYAFHHTNLKKTFSDFSDLQPFGGTKNQLLMLQPLLEMPLDPGTRKAILNVHAEEWILSWLIGLHRRNANITTLAKTWLSRDEICELSLPLSLNLGAISSLYHDFNLLQQYLMDHPKATLQDIFQTLNPNLASYYSWMLKKHGTPLAAFKKLYSNERPMEEGKNKDARLGPGALKGRWLFESLNQFKKSRNGSIEKAVCELMNAMDLPKLMKEPEGPKRCSSILKMLSSIAGEDVAQKSLETSDLARSWLLAQERLSVRSSLKSIPPNPLDDKRCERLLKSRDDIELRKLVKQDILAALQSDNLPAPMKKLFPYHFITKILQNNPSIDDSVRIVLDEFCMRPEVYEDFLAYTFQNLGRKDLPPGIAAAIENLKSFTKEHESYAIRSA